MIFAYTKAKAESVSRVGDSFFCYRRSQIAFRYLSLSLSLSLLCFTKYLQGVLEPARRMYVGYVSVYEVPRLL